MVNEKLWKLVNEVYSTFLTTFAKSGDVEAVYFILEEIGDREDLSEKHFDFLCNKVYDKIPFF